MPSVTRAMLLVCQRDIKGSLDATAASVLTVHAESGESGRSVSAGCVEVGPVSQVHHGLDFLLADPGRAQNVAG